MTLAQSLASPRLTLTYVPDVPTFDLAAPARCGVYYLTAGEEPVGAVSLTGLARSHAEIGYEIEQAFRGQGFATEAVTAALAHGATHHGFTVFSAVARSDNAASRRVLEKAGFTRVGAKLCWSENAGQPATIESYRLCMR